MTTTHAQRTVYAGDQWEIPGKLYDRDRTPLNLTGVDIEWAFTDAVSGSDILTQDNVVIQVTNATHGEFMITADPQITVDIPAGHYVDTLRVTASAIPRETMWTGAWVVRASSFPLTPLGVLRTVEGPDQSIIRITVAGGSL